MQIAVFGIEKWQEEYLTRKLSTHTIFATKDILTLDNVAQTTDCEILCVFSNSTVSSDIIDKLPRLKLITTTTTGYDHIDIHYAQEKGIVVCNVPLYGENTVAEFAMALLLTLSRKIISANRTVRVDLSFDTERLMGFDLQNKTLGIIGTGHIGQHMIKIAKSFDMNVVAYDAYPNNKLCEALGFTYVELEKLLGQSDVISLHVPYLPSTHHLLNKDNMQKIKKGAVLINTARGAVIDTEALVQALENRTLAGAGLDVLENEEVFKSKSVQDKNPQLTELNKKLISMPQVIVTPHNAFNTKEATQRRLDTTIENINAFIAQTPQNIVKPA